MGWDKQREEHNAEQRSQAAKMVTGALKVTAQQVYTTTWLNMAESDVGQPFSYIPINLLGPDNSSRKSPSGLSKQLCGNNTKHIVAIDSSSCPAGRGTQPHLVDIVPYHRVGNRDH